MFYCVNSGTIHDPTDGCLHSAIHDPTEGRLNKSEHCALQLLQKLLIIIKHYLVSVAGFDLHSTSPH